MAAPIGLSKSCLRVSSVLNKDVKQFGKKHLCDGDDDTCWNSDQGSPQWIQVQLEEPICLESVHIQFQGGFAGRDCWIEAITSDCEPAQFSKLQDFYPEDINSLQIFKVTSGEKLYALKIVFNSSTDFFGRITIYKLEIFGKPS